MNIKMDIMSIGSPNFDGMPKAPYTISDSVLNSVIRMQENKILQQSIKEYKVVVQALELVSEDSKLIFDELYVKNKYKWDIIDLLNKSEETYKRRKKDLIYAVHKELKKEKNL